MPEEDLALRQARVKRWSSSGTMRRNSAAETDGILSRLVDERTSLIGTHGRRMSYADAGVHFFRALQACSDYLDDCVTELQVLRVWRCDPHAAERQRNSAARVQGYVRVWQARREQRYLQALCQYILLMDCSDWMGLQPKTAACTCANKTRTYTAHLHMIHASIVARHRARSSLSQLGVRCAVGSARTAGRALHPRHVAFAPRHDDATARCPTVPPPSLFSRCDGRWDAGVADAARQRALRRSSRRRRRI